MGLRPLEIFQFFQCGDRFYTSESAAYRRQILTYKDGPRAQRAKPPFHTNVQNGISLLTKLHKNVVKCFLDRLKPMLSNTCI